MLVPVRNKVLVKPHENPMSTPHGIIIPDTSQGRPCKGEVISIGPDVTDVKVGDVILFNVMGAVEIFDVNGNGKTKYLILKEDLIHAIEGE